MKGAFDNPEVTNKLIRTKHPNGARSRDLVIDLKIMGRYQKWTSAGKKYERRLAGWCKNTKITGIRREEVALDPDLFTYRRRQFFYFAEPVVAHRTIDSFFEVGNDG